MVRDFDVADTSISYLIVAAFSVIVREPVVAHILTTSTSMSAAIAATVSVATEADMD